jgi:hypothetical protein
MKLVFHRASIERWSAFAVRQNAAAVDIGHTGRAAGVLMDRLRSAGYFEIRRMSGYGMAACDAKRTFVLVAPVIEK